MHACMYAYMHTCMACIHTNRHWSKPGSINTSQKQGPGQAAGRTPGKLGGNMPVKLAKMRSKKEPQTE